MHQIKKENEENKIKESKSTRVCINYKLQVVNETQLAIMNRQANLVPHFTCLAVSIKIFHFFRAIQM